MDSRDVAHDAEYLSSDVPFYIRSRYEIHWWLNAHEVALRPVVRKRALMAAFWALRSFVIWPAQRGPVPRSLPDSHLTWTLQRSLLIGFGILQRVTRLFCCSFRIVLL